LNEWTSYWDTLYKKRFSLQAGQLQNNL